jgi:hypothetical protein
LVALREGAVDVVIEGHTMSMGNRMYNIGNLVGTTVADYPIGFVGGPFDAIRAKKWRFFFIFVAYVVLSSPVARLVLLAAFVAQVVEIVRMLQNRSTGYMLKLETAGSVTGVITSQDPDEVNKLARRVAEAINNPPTTAKEFVIYGDLVQQTGNNNVATQVKLD